MLASQKGGFTKNYWEEFFGFIKIHEKAFDSERKLMSVVYNIRDSTSLGLSKPTNLVLVKGAPEELLRKCTHHLPKTLKETIRPFDVIFGEKEGCKPKELSDEFVDIISKQSSRMASQGLRILGLALKIIQNDDDGITNSNDESNSEQSTSNPLFDETDLTFVGLIGLIDPPKKSVKESIKKCKEAGIQVIMITGDHIATATAIAKDIGIIEPGDQNTVLFHFIT